MKVKFAKGMEVELRYRPIDKIRHSMVPTTKDKASLRQICMQAGIRHYHNCLPIEMPFKED
jgi:hypothetical protein